MGTITIRKLDETIKDRLRLRAARHKRSMEEEARNILRVALAEESVPPLDLGRAIQKRFKAVGGVVLDIPPREPMREPPELK